MHPRPQHLVGVLTLLVLGCGDPTPTPQVTELPGIDHSFEANLRQLLSRNSHLRKMAYEVFERNWPVARNHVAELATRKSKVERVAGAYLMMRLGTREDLPSLRAFLRDHHKPVRLAAISGIQRLRDKDSIPALEQLLETASYVESQQVLEALVTIEPTGSEAIALAESKSEAWSRRRAAAQALGHLTSEASARRLLELLEDRIWLVRMDATDALGRRHLKSALPALRRAAGDESENVRAAAIRALAENGAPEDETRVLVAAESDPHETVRVAAIELLCKRSGDNAVATLVKIANSSREPETIRKAAIRSLGANPAPEAIAKFSKLLASDNAALRDLAEATVASEKLPWAKAGDAWQHTPAKSPR